MTFWQKEWLLLVVALFSVSVLACADQACNKPTTILTVPGKTAYTADQIALRVNELENAAIQANASGGLPTTTTKLIVRFTVSADKILAVTPSGWQATVATSWKETKLKLQPITNSAVSAAIAAVDVALAAFGA